MKNELKCNFYFLFLIYLEYFSEKETSEFINDLKKGIIILFNKFIKRKKVVS